ncbi:hypothetical protein [Corallococcus sp. AS-1-12]|uniref:hypothetical protein n=1 Tax=Corallococcus sp. AS-1-12 TaxID=2874598 RepID=UPI001CC1099D|nr:hypothetical protein [Corallococcus sp. AS-1-12]MBZ4329243.1 hypothetical protein [Corallococcus sp. AS-1-12]
MSAIRPARALALLAFALLAPTAPFLFFAVARLAFHVPIEPNEGWNALHTVRLVGGGPLYLPFESLPLAPVNYPPLSFLVMKALSPLSPDLLVLGRVVAALAFLGVGGLIAATVAALAPGRRWPALLGALVWVSVGGHAAYRYLGMYEPQMLGHVFSTGALYLFVRWRERLRPGHIAVLALLCCMGLLVKHLLVATPLALALVLLRLDRRLFLHLAAWGVAWMGALGAVGGALAGGDMLSNILAVEHARGKSLADGAAFTWEVLLAPGAGLLLLPVVALWRERRREWDVVFAYVIASLLEGGLAVVGDGVDVNAWFDFFIGASVAAGLLGAVLLQGQPLPWRRRAAWACLVATLVPVGMDYRTRFGESAATVQALPVTEATFARYAALLREARGPVLYEDRLMGFLSGKPYLFDRFTGAALVRSGAVPERVLADPLRAGTFDWLVFERDIRPRLAELRGRGYDWSRVTGAPGLAWTDNVLLSIDEAYEYVPSEGPYHVYRPRRSAAVR